MARVKRTMHYAGRRMHRQAEKWLEGSRKQTPRNRTLARIVDYWQGVELADIDSRILRYAIG